jgi:hypothetical protein
MGYKQTVNDPCLFHNERKGTYVIVYVDDMIMYYRNDEDAMSFLMDIEGKYKVGKVEDGRYFVGLHIRKNELNACIYQQRYTEAVVKKYEDYIKRESSTPMGSNLDLRRMDEEITRKPYREVVGALLYLSNGTGPDIAYAVGMLSRYMEKAEEKHWEAAMKVISYLKGTAKVGIEYSLQSGTNLFEGELKLSGLKLEAYVDSDWGTDKDGRKSITGYVVKMLGGPIAWRSRKQKSVALSSMEAEYMALADAIKEVMYIRSLLHELSIDIDEPTTIWEDNNACLELTRNPEHHERAKHIDIRYHFIRDVINKGEMEVKRVDTKDQVADGLTKSLNTKRFMELRMKMGLKEVDINDNSVGALE